METEIEIRNKIRPIMEYMIFQLAYDKPENPVNIQN
jgi:hypothetical protein